jgi:hypothetical protein
MSCGAAGEIARARRDATVTYFIGQRIYLSLLRSAFAKTLADAAIGLPLPILSTAISGFVLGQGFHAGQDLMAFVGGALCGLAIAPAMWSLALYVREPHMFSGVVGLVGYVAISLAPHGLSELGPLVLSPLEPVNFLAVPGKAGVFIVVWLFGWSVIAAVASAIGALLTSFVRSGGDLIVDAVH